MLTILTIDDEAPIRLMIRVNLEAAGMRVVEASDGPTGLEVARREQPDLILLDVMMPALDGWQVAERLQEMPETRAVPIIFVTPRKEYRDRRHGIGLGAVDYVTEPFNPLQLADRVNEALARIARGEREMMRREKIAQFTALENAGIDPDSPEGAS